MPPGSLQHTAFSKQSVELALALSMLAGGLADAAQQPLLPPSATPPPVSPSLAGLEAIVKVPYLQTVRLLVPAASRVLSVRPDLIEASLAAEGIVELRAVNFGQTFVHIWTPEGRLTRAVEVVQPVLEVAAGLGAPKTAEELARHLVFEYRNAFRNTRRGPLFSKLDRTTTTQFFHHLSSRMDTPYGRASGSVSFERFNAVSDVTSWSASLADGRIGPLEHFSVIGGDASAGFSDLSLPQGSLRGVWARSDALAPYALEGFYGRRQLGFAGGLSAGLTSRDDFFLAGGRLQQTQKPWTWAVAYANASGDDRIDLQSSQAAEANTWYWLHEGMRLGAEAGFTQDHAFAYRLKWLMSSPDFSLETTYRNLSQRYENLLGRAVDQGERGAIVNAQWTPLPVLRLRHHLDLFEDTLFRNPQEPDVLNVDLELAADLDVTGSTTLTSAYSRQRFLGQLFPSDGSTVSAGIRQRLGQLPLIGRGYLLADYRFHDARSVNSPEADFESHGVILGLGAPLWESFSWRVTQEWTLLEETLTARESRPRQTSAGLSYFRQFRRLPVSLHGGVDFTKASSAGSASSFILNEDRWSLNGGARYDLSPDAHAFVESRLIRANRPAARDYEFAFETGLRYLFDTGVAWEPSTSVSGIVFLDGNGNGRQEGGEAGLARVTVRGDAKEAVTDPGGRFYLGRVRGRRVDVAVDLASIPQGHVPTTPAAITIDVAKPPKPPLLFGFVAQGELRIRVFLDAQGNGRYDATDVPLEKLRISLQDGTVLRTDRSGWALFRGVTPGPYQVTLHIEDLPAGLLPATALTQEASLREGQAATVDFPVTAERSISGRVYVDHNRNGRHDHEPPMAGVAVCLDGAAQVATLEDGRYFFKGVHAGLHRVALNCGRPLVGFLPLNAVDQAVDVSPQPVQIEGIDFRLAPQEALMQDVVADVLRARREQQHLIDEMIELKKTQQSIESTNDQIPNPK
ncbi:MAG: hypothetical protein HY598_03665 [Candidatus Omnitrophica bacterium]|nr:hypothetical protein [Candidatus Omnitrophota bacterium]